MDRQDAAEISDLVSICNFGANRLCCEATSQAIQVRGGTATRGRCRSSISTAATASPQARKKCKAPRRTVFIGICGQARVGMNSASEPAQTAERRAHGVGARN